MQGPNSVVNSYIPVVAPRDSVPVALALYNSVTGEGEDKKEMRKMRRRCGVILSSTTAAVALL
jgi:hypothetical protein